MSLSKKEIEWFNGLQEYLLTAPASVKKKVKNGELGAYTAGDYDVTIFDNKAVSEFNNQSRERFFDVPHSVDRAEARLETLFFPFKIEIA